MKRRAQELRAEGMSTPDAWHAARSELFPEQVARERRRENRAKVVPTIVIAVVVGVVTVGVLSVTAMGCWLSPSTYVGWGCREGTTYWPDLLMLFIPLWAAAGLLIWMTQRGR